MQSLHLLYHELRPGGSEYSYVTSCEDFEQHCAFYARLRGQCDSGNSLLRPELTFDDGHVSDWRYALPVLERHGLSASFFITAGWTGKRAGYMNWSELRELLSAGHHIGAHGLEHKLLTGCSEAELDSELRASRLLLEDGLGIKIRTMSLPGGRANGRVLRACERAGYQQIFTSVPLAVDLSLAPKLIGRLNLVGGTSLSWLEKVLTPATGFLRRIERVDRIKGAAKQILGDGLYSRLWALANRQEVDAAATEAP